MNSSMNYHSTLAPYLKSHIEGKMALGLKCEQDKWTYKEFDAHLASVRHDREHLTREDYNLWYKKISVGSKKSTIYAKVSTIRRFLIFSLNRDMSATYQECQKSTIPASFPISTLRMKWQPSSRQWMNYV